ncbi:MAG: putative selenate reductase subunit YgfK [Spirochaetales bacterium]|nr:putative selenate reductase subunit YgfK [Spirochaetales bacterium]
MRYLTFSDLIERVRDEWRAEKTIFGIPEKNIFKKTNDKSISVFGNDSANEQCATPMGPAAGPHTQLVQNIMASWLTGCRFIELKTVQKLDSLEIDKPCIDATDEGYNTEWSTELSLEQAWQEYAKAWVLLHLFRQVLGGDGKPDGFVFNMSVGYDLEGIKTPPMQEYLSRMMDSSNESLFKGWVAEAEALLSDATFMKEFGKVPDSFAAPISGKICNSLTLSTMHGCPPHEIEAICRYMLTEKGLNTFVKLNPTLLGYDWVRKTMDGLGFTSLTLKRESFEHDLQYADALGILTRLRADAKEAGLAFGVKLTNTLGSVNDKGILPGDEMYMSGRALFPLSINLAARLSKEFDGTLPISYSGGITAHNVARVFRTGIRPVTAATEMLKPGGYLRIGEMASLLENETGWESEKIDVAALEKLASDALTDKVLTKDFRGTDEASVAGVLPAFDCYVAPCIQACAINQHIPGYIKLAGEGRYGEALTLIYEQNALPSITGHICDHQCQLHCTRMDYEGCVGIREVKRQAVLNGFNDFKKNFKKREDNGKKVAVVGAGPAGLSTAYFLAREGFSVTVFEREPNAGGVVRNVVPHFRISREAIESDVAFIRELGVQFRFNTSPTGEEIKALGFQTICLATGTYVSRDFSIPGGEGKMMSSLAFLTKFNKDSKGITLGKSVAVMGAGDTAMDTARSALRCPGVADVTIVYRRSFTEMPASREEYEDAVIDGIKFKFLTTPEKFTSPGVLSCMKMELGEPDESGRRRPVATGTTEEIKADTLLYAIGDDPESETFKAFGLTPDNRGYVQTNEGCETESDDIFVVGDVRTGPSTIVQCISEGRKAADAICRKADPEWDRPFTKPFWQFNQRKTDLSLRKGSIIMTEKADDKAPDSFLKNEAARCLECNFICQKCVDVCPNRANIFVSLPEEAGFMQKSQIIHIDGYCNECGNCGTFCPWEGNPYKDKPTVFSSRADFDDSENPGWFLEGDSLVYRLPPNTESRDRTGETGSTPFKDGKVDSSLKNSDELTKFFTLMEILHTRRPALFGPMEE